MPASPKFFLSRPTLTLDCIGNSDALYHNIEHSMLVTLAGHDILMGRQMLADDDRKRLCEFHPGVPGP